GPQDVAYQADVVFTLRTSIADGKLVFIGVTGEITDQVNPDLRVPEGAVVQINLVNDDGAIHDIAVPEFNVKSDNITGKGAATAVVFRATKSRSEERRVGKECRSRRVPEHYRKK